MSLDEEDIDLDESANVSGYCHFNDSEENKSFSVNFSGLDLIFEQSPGSRDIGHGAVVWDAAVVFSKFVETNPSLFSAYTGTNLTLV